MANNINTSSANNQTSVNITSTNALSQIGVTTPQSYYDGLSKQWAIGEGLIQGVDYSSKTYAQQSKESALSASLSETNAKTSEETAQSIVTLGQEAIEEQKNNYISELETKTQDSLSSIDDKAREELSNIDNLAKSYDNLTQRQITNCVTEIPQRIKLELNNGTLTLKAGSIVVVPYGAEDRTAEFPIGSKFLNDYFEVYETSWDGEKFFVYVKNIVDINDGTAHTGATTVFNFIDMLTGSIYRTARTESGTGNPSTTYCGYYNTDTNLIKSSGNTTSYVDTILTLPLCITSSAASDTTWYGAINQVFNGMGYIGSTAWIDKGVKSLIPNGRNEDGSYNNKLGETTRIHLQTNPFGAVDSGLATMFLMSKDELVGVDESLGFGYRYIVSTVEPSEAYVTWYNPQTNLIFYRASTSDAWQRRHMTPCMSVKYDFESNTNKSTFTGLIPKLPFRAIDYSDKSEISAWTMPSDKYIDLTLGASGSTYTAPANGWFALHKTAGIANAYVSLRNTTSAMSVITDGYNAASTLAVYMPTSKGQKISSNYTATGATNHFRFIYAIGEV